MSVACIMCLTMLILKSSTKMVMGKTGMVRILCLLRFHPKGNLCGVKNKLQINGPFIIYVVSKIYCKLIDPFIVLFKFW